MNRFFHNVSLIIINFFLFNLYAFSNEEIIKTETVINDIIIFNNGASINRTGNVILSNGSNNILISNLSSKLLNESIQFTIKSKNVIINSVNKQLNYFSSENNIQVIKLDDSIQKINEKIRLRTVDLEVLREEKDLMDQNKSVLKTSREFIIDDLMELAEYFKKKINEIQANISLIQKEISFLNQTKKMDRLKLNAIWQLEVDSLKQRQHHDQWLIQILYHGHKLNCILHTNHDVSIVALYRSLRNYHFYAAR